MSEHDEKENPREAGQEAGGLRQRITQRGEDTLLKVAETVLDSTAVGGAVQAVFDAREKAAQAQEAAMEALNLPSATDLQRIARRLRSVSDRLEDVEDGIDRIEGRVGQAFEARLGKLEAGVAELARELAAIKDSLPAAASPVPQAQERLAVRE